MKAQGKEVSIKKLCQWFGVARSTIYYKPLMTHGKRRSRLLDQALTEQIRQAMEANPEYGVRRLTAIVRKDLNRAVNKKAVHRIIKANGWQVRKKSRGFRKRAPGMSSRSKSSNERWAIDTTAIFCGEDGWCPFTAIIDCHDRNIVGWRLSDTGVAKHAAGALEEALMSRKKELMSNRLLLRSDNGLIFGSKAFTKVAREYGIEQEYITPYTPEQNGMIERFFRSLKEECIWHHQFKNRDEAFIVIAKWIDKYHTERPHSALGYKTPEEFKNGLQVA